MALGNRPREVQLGRRSEKLTIFHFYASLVFAVTSHSGWCYCFCSSQNFDLVMGQEPKPGKVFSVSSMVCPF